MNIILYRMSCEYNRVDKSNYISQIVELNGTLRESCSITQPSIDFFLTNQILILDNDVSTIVDSSEEVLDGGNVSNTQRYDIGVLFRKIISCNYMYIPTFNRYYFIDDIISVRNNLWRIVAHVDVLMSFKKEIFNQTVLINRNEFDFDLFLTDKNIVKRDTYDFIFMNYSNFMIDNYTGTESFTVDTSDTHYIAQTMATAKNLALNNDNLIDNTPTISPTVIISYFDSTDDYYYFLEDILSPNFWESAGDMFQNHSEFLSALYICPLPLYDLHEVLKINNISPIGLLGDKMGIPVGETITSTPSGYIVTNASKVIMFARIQGWTKEQILKDFTDLNPFCKYMLFLPFYGFVEVDSDFLTRDNYNYVVYNIDISSGDFVAYLSSTKPTYQNTYMFPYQRWHGNLFVPLPVGRTNLAEIHANKMRAALNSLAGTSSAFAGGVTGIGLGSMMNNKGGDFIAGNSVSQSITGIFGSVSSYLIDEITNRAPRGSQEPLKGNSLVFRDSHTPYILKIKPSIFFPDNYNHTFGRPLFQERKLSEVRGYTLVYDAHLTGFVDATSEEQQEIINLLESGIFFPEQ